MTKKEIQENIEWLESKLAVGSSLRNRALTGSPDAITRIEKYKKGLEMLKIENIPEYEKIMTVY